jgi:tRNA 2-thiouridine synthesizing protein A
MDVDREIDARGLNCPLPILRTKKTLADMQSGQTLRVLATDPGSVPDFNTFAKNTGHQLLESQQVGSEFIYVLKKR